MELGMTVTIIAIAVAALLINIPLGKLRSKQRKLSPKWFLYVHLSIPVIYALRNLAGIGLWVVPFFIAAAVLGQIIGGK
jgi:hypothetical protein